MKLFPLHQIDFYKSGHIFQYPDRTEDVYSNFTARSDRLAPVLRKGIGAFDGKIVNYGLQGLCIEFFIENFNDGFFSLPKDKAVYRYQRRMDNALGKGAVPIAHIEALHDLGYLPLVIKALPEGALVDIKVPLLTVRATLPQFAWLTNYVETVLSSSLWKSITVATLAYQFRRLVNSYAEQTGGDPMMLGWQGHDFSARGMSGPEDAARSSSGHLLSFFGTDTVAALDYLEDYYGADSDTELLGGSVPATEHSVMSMGGKLDELSTFRRLITEVYPSGVVSIVSDTWDFWQVITEYATILKPEILARPANALGLAKVVFRPDSGDPVKILTGYLDSELLCEADGTPQADQDGRYQLRTTDGADRQYITASERKGAVECLWDIFGGSISAKGFKLLDSHVGLIYGDSITLPRAQAILERLKLKNFASTNVVFGIGSFSYQYLSRDSFGMAMKATSGVVEGERRDLSKDPKTDSGVKKSAVGLLRVEIEDGQYILYDRQSEEQEAQGELKEIFRDSKMVHLTTVADMRARVRQALIRESDVSMPQAA